MESLAYLDAGITLLSFSTKLILTLLELLALCLLLLVARLSTILNLVPQTRVVDIKVCSGSSEKAKKLPLEGRQRDLIP